MTEKNPRLSLRPAPEPSGQRGAQGFHNLRPTSGSPGSGSGQGSDAASGTGTTTGGTGTAPKSGDGGAQK